MGVMEFVVAVLATWQIVEVWRHGALFASWRARVEIWDDLFPWGFLRDMLGCPFCLAVWAAFANVLILSTDTLSGMWLLRVWRTSDTLFTQIPIILAITITKLGFGFVWGSAISRAANLCNDLTHRYCRTPRSNRNIVIPVEATVVPPEQQV